jgi:hypothetical protein
MLEVDWFLKTGAWGIVKVLQKRLNEGHCTSTASVAFFGGRTTA